MQDSFYELSKNRFLLISLFILTITVFSLSCHQNLEKPENVCTLTLEQIPEVRGFRLGMKYYEVKNKFADFCESNEFVKNVSNETVRSITIKLYQDYDKGKYTNGKCSLTGSDNKYLNYSLNIAHFPDYEGVDEINLAFEDSKVSNIKIAYELTRDSQLVKTFEDKTINALGLSQWTNWEIERKERLSYVKSLLCNHVKISLSAEDISSRADSLYEMYVQIEKSDKIALTKSQKEEIENQKKQEETLSNENLKLKEKETRDTFKP